MQADDRGAQKGKAGQFRGLPNATQSSYHGTMCEQKGGSSGVAAEAQSDQAAWVVVRSGQWRAEADDEAARDVADLRRQAGKRDGAKERMRMPAACLPATPYAHSLTT